MSRGEIQVFISSLHVIHDELASIGSQVPDRVYAELSAMEAYLKKELEKGGFGPVRR